MTIKELAEELQVSKTAINNRLIDLDLKGRCTKQGNKIVLPADVVEEIRQSFNKTTGKPAGNPGIDEDVIQLLYAQIEQLNEHIRTLNKQLEVKDLQIERAQAVQYRLTADHNPTEPHEVDAVQVEETEGNKSDSIRKSGGFFSKIFG